MTISRREWLRLASAVPLLADYFQPLAQAQATGDRTLVTACGLCDSTCGTRATVRDGVVRFLEGLPGDQHGAGGLCAKGAASLATKYDPDRLKYPMRRTNPNKGLDVDPEWVRITWDEALETITQRFGGYLSQFGPESLLFVTRNSPDLWARLMNALGILNRVDHNDQCYVTERVIHRYMIGPHTFAYDFANSKYIVLFGWDLVARSKIVFCHQMAAARDNGAKVICFNPQYTATARMADEWYPIRPGSDLAVVLAMIQALLAENLFDREFVQAYTNFSQYEGQIRQAFQQYTPEWAESRSDVPASVIRRIAREFGERRPAVAPLHKKTVAANYLNSTQAAFAISALNILAGNIDRPGGRYFPRTISIPSVDAVYPPPAFPPKTGTRVDGRDKLPLVNEANNGMFSTLADGMLNRHRGQIKGVFWQSYSLNSFPQPDRIVEAMKTAEFMVVMDILPVDAALLADIVLPSTMFLEGSGLVGRTNNAKSPQIVVRQALTSAPFETRSLGWLAIELGKRLAPDYFRTESGSWISSSALLDEQAKRTGVAGTFAEFRAKGLHTVEAPFVPRTTFAAPGGKCQIYVPEFAARGYPPLPVWFEKHERPSAQYPYYLLTYIPAVHRRNSSQNNAILHEMMPENAAVMHPSLAAKLGLAEGMPARVSSRVGSITLPAHLTETVRPDCVLVAHGFGHVSPKVRLASARGARDSDLIPGLSIDEVAVPENFGGSGCVMDAVVNVEPAA
ncbi:MAG: molybdopterin-dependent oxidoreductase [Bryobacterales bacterium]|nr:molybdopterin-dependent oxidoreductase [Bryobacterales bacterium]